MRNVQVERFGDFRLDAVAMMNEFIRDKDVIDIKQNMVITEREEVYVEYLVIYKEEVA